MLNASWIYTDEIPQTVLQIPTGVKVVEENAFRNTAVETVEIPATVELIETGAFIGCATLQSVTVLGSTTVIREGALPEGITIYCASGSTAEAYGLSHNCIVITK